MHYVGIHRPVRLGLIEGGGDAHLDTCKLHAHNDFGPVVGTPMPTGASGEQPPQPSTLNPRTSRANESASTSLHPHPCKSLCMEIKARNKRPALNTTGG